jgi:hypothetical protein
VRRRDRTISTLQFFVGPGIHFRILTEHLYTSGPTQEIEAAATQSVSTEGARTPAEPRKLMQG